MEVSRVREGRGMWNYFSGYKVSVWDDERSHNIINVLKTTIIYVHKWLQ